jgi:glycosyltransferase involved in cell wall biosynthesis
MNALIAIPCYNEEEVIENTIKNILKYVSKNNIKIAIFDDGSTDNTLEIISNIPDVEVLSTKQNYGLSEVFNSIVYYAKENNYENILIFDADNQYPEDEIMNLINTLNMQKYDILLGARNFKNNKIFSKSKNMLQFYGSKVISSILGIKLADVTTGFRVYSSKALESIFITNNFSYTVESLFYAKRMNLKIGEVHLNKFYKTRSSRLFSNNTEYIKKTLNILISSIILHKKSSLFKFYLVSTIPGILLVARFIRNYVLLDGYGGNVQSLMIGLIQITVVTIFYSLLINTSLLKNNLLNIQRESYKPKYKKI